MGTKIRPMEDMDSLTLLDASTSTEFSGDSSLCETSCDPWTLQDSEFSMTMADQSSNCPSANNWDNSDFAHPGKEMNDSNLPEEEDVKEISDFDNITSQLRQFLTSSSAIKQWDDTVAEYQEPKQTSLDQGSGGISNLLVDQFMSILSDCSSCAAFDHQNELQQDCKTSSHSLEKPPNMSMVHYWEILQLLFEHDEEKDLLHCRSRTRMSHGKNATTAMIFLNGISEQDMDIFWANFYNTFPKADDRKMILMYGISVSDISDVLSRIYSKPICAVKKQDESKHEHMKAQKLRKIKGEYEDGLDEYPDSQSYVANANEASR